MSRELDDVPPHYLKSNKAKYFPQRMIIYDTEAKIKKRKNGEKIHELELGYAVYLRKGRKEKWIYFEDTAKFWDFVERKSYGDTMLYVFAHNEDYDFHLLEGWNELLNRGWTMDFQAIGKGVFFVKYSMLDKKGKKRRVMVCDTHNLFPMKLREVGKAIGLKKGFVKFKSVSKEKLAEYCKRDVEILKEALTILFFYLEQENLSGFKPTLASLAMSIFRHHYLKYDILIHRKKTATQLERRAYRGGKCECFKIGKFTDGKYYRLDINSMYPYIMERFNYPVFLKGETLGITEARLRELLENYCVIADCNITTKKSALGIKGKWLIFPIGTFKATLTTEELKWILRNGKINYIRHVVWYKPAPIFKEFIDELYAYRLKWKEEGNNALDLITKLIMNSLYGKFGQKNREMIEIGKSIYANKVELFLNYDTGERKRIYHIGGKMFEKAGKETEARDALPCICAEVTANARLYLFQFIEKAGYENIFYCDTDSLILNEAGLERLKSYINLLELGKFKIEKVSNEIEVWDLKDYRLGSELKRKGIKPDAVEIEPNKFKQEHFFHHKTLMRRPDIKTTGTYPVKKELKREYKKGVVENDGTVEPFTLQERIS